MRLSSPAAEDRSPRWLRALTDPMRAWSPQAQWLAVGCAVALGVAAVVAVVPLGLIFHAPDSSHYLKIAAGNTANVMQPFASRQMGARVAAALAVLLHGNLHGGFLLEAALALLFTMGVVCTFAVKTAAPRWLLVALVLVPSWPLLVHYLVLPDLWYAALVALLIVMLARQQYLLSAILMLPLMLSRESTSLTLLCFLAAGWKLWNMRQRWLYAITAIAAALVGSVIVSGLAAGSQPNKEHLPQALYLFAKLPWNFLRNVAGVLPWSDANTDLCMVPMWQMPVHLPMLRSVHAVGVCGFSLDQQLQAVEGTLTNFGLLPLIVAVLWWHLRRTPSRNVMLRFALLYGGVSYLLAPVIGAGFVHLMQYAWPLFLVALPQLFNELPQRPFSVAQQVAGVALLGLHLAAGTLAVWPLLVPWFLPRICLGLALWLAGYQLLRQWSGTGLREKPANTV